LPAVAGRRRRAGSLGPPDPADQKGRRISARRVSRPGGTLSAGSRTRRTRARTSTTGRRSRRRGGTGSPTTDRVSPRGGSSGALPEDPFVLPAVEVELELRQGRGQIVAVRAGLLVDLLDLRLAECDGPREQG